ncbi:ATP-binding protein [Micromonospora profundi]|uniref:ATP-binding protein n=2 Tax=Micromonospora TaxID=1873 RepID=UPI0035E43D23
MIGRRRELAAVHRMLDRAVAGAGGRLIVVGPPGSGKSVLGDAAADLARQRGLPVERTTAAGRTGARLVLLDDLDQESEAAHALDSPAGGDLTVGTWKRTQAEAASSPGTNFRPRSRRTFRRTRPVTRRPRSAPSPPTPR